MRKWMFVGLAFLLFPWLVSLLWISVSGSEKRWSLPVNSEVSDEKNDSEISEKQSAEKEISSAEIVREKRIKVKKNGVQTYLSLESYLPGVILCQVGPEVPLEALKSQAVIARTYICRLMDGRTEIGEEELDLDYLGEFEQGIMVKNDQVLVQLEQCEQAVRETRGIVMKWNGREILPLFHKMSAGRTRNGTNDFPYLVSVESSWDRNEKGFLTEKAWSLREFADRINQLSGTEGVTLGQLPGQIQVVEKDDSGYVLQIKIGARTYSGEEVQYALGLASACYTLEGDQNDIRAVVRGCGHGYGLSQTGAAAMAKEGWSYEDILYHYYKNISLVSE